MITLTIPLLDFAPYETSLLIIILIIRVAVSLYKFMLSLIPVVGS